MLRTLETDDTDDSISFHTIVGEHARSREPAAESTQHESREPAAESKEPACCRYIRDTSLSLILIHL
jgi:hypothetical protein